VLGDEGGEVRSVGIVRGRKYSNVNNTYPGQVIVEPPRTCQMTCEGPKYGISPAARGDDGPKGESP